MGHEEVKEIAVSVVVIAKNEQQDLPGCLASLSRFSEAFVIDAVSEDKTADIARSYGATVLTRPFTNFAEQRNWALETCSFSNQWVLFIDADERVTPEFAESVSREITKAAPEISGFYCCSKTIIQGKWLKRADGFPKWQFRLLKLGQARFEECGHGQREAEGGGILGYIHEPYIHYPLSKGWSDWFSKHNWYSSKEAELRAFGKVNWRNLFSGHPAVRKKALRMVANGIPGWPLLYFLLRYVARFGFLEGRPAFEYCANMAYYEFLITIKIRELRRLSSKKAEGR